MLKRIFSFSNFTLLVALTVSTIAAWYSIIGLTTIFAGAVVPVIIMGSALELAKITTTVWLRKYWHRAGLLLKLYLVPAVMAIALITSMGIFGFLSKAHIDQGIGTGDIGAQVSLLDEKIKTERDNIDTSKKALQQMDAQVDQMLSRTDTDKGAEKAVQIRRNQAKERAALQSDIAKSQAAIKAFNEERIPIASQLRKTEAEVGPIKYIAALIYGDNPDQNILEKAVRWVIILLVIVFDPLALMLVLAANQSKDWDDEEPVEKIIEDEPVVEATIPEPIQEEVVEVTEKEFDINDHPYLFTPVGSQTPPGIEPVPIQVYKSEPSDDTLEPCYKCGTQLIVAPGIGPFCPNKECDVLDSWALKNEEPVEITMPTVVADLPETEELPTEGMTIEKPFTELGGGYVVFDGKHMHQEVLKGMRPDLFKLVADNARQSNTNFGTEFPKIALKGDSFVRVDVLPNRVYKFDGNRWIMVNKDISNGYIHDQEYVKYLISKIDSGEYDIDLLNDIEKQQIEDYLTKKI
jgi:hypothetical protein